MKILFINKYSGINGVQIGILNRHIGLKKWNIDSDFLCIHGNEEVMAAKDSDLNIYYARDEAEILDIILKNGYDIISAIDCPDVHRVLDKLPHNIKVFGEVRNPNDSSREYLRKGELPVRAKCIVTPSFAFKKVVEHEIKGHSDIPVYVIPNFVTERFLNFHSKADVFIPKKYIGWIGRFSEIKNYKEVLQIADEISYQRNDLEFILVGNFPVGYDGKFSDEVRDFKNRINLKWLPFIEYSKMHNFYRLLRDSGGCYISTSRGESFSNTALESMASRCPVVTTDIENYAELLDNGRCGLIYKLGDIKSAIEKINMALDDMNIRNSIVSSAYEKVITNYTTEAVMPKWKSLFESLS